MRELTCRMRKGPRVGRLTVEFMSAAAGGSSAAKSTAKRPKLSLSRKRPLGTNTQTPVQPPQPPPPPNPPQEVPQIQIAPPPVIDRCKWCGENLGDQDAESKAAHRANCEGLAARIAAEQAHILEAAPVTPAAAATAPQIECTTEEPPPQSAPRTPPAEPPPPPKDADVLHESADPTPLPPPPPAAAASTSSTSSLWRLAASCGPSDYTSGGSFPSFVPVPTTSDTTAEGLTCAACTHHIRIDLGVHYDHRREPLCASCASIVGLLNPISRSKGGDGMQEAHAVARAEAERAAEAAKAEEAAFEEEEWSGDLEAATRHIERRLRGGGADDEDDDEEEERDALRGMVESGEWSVQEIGARGVLAAYEEAETLVREEEEDDDDEEEEEGGGVARTVFDALVRRWEAPIPMRLLRALQEGMADDPEGSVDPRGDALLERIRKLREDGAERFKALGLRLGSDLHDDE